MTEQNKKTFEYSKKTNLIERRIQEYILNDVPEPQLYRDLFSYDEVPKVTFNHRLVPINMPDEIWITDTTFRDGQQSIAPYTTEQIVRIFEYLHRLSGPNGI
ncbi:MAG: 2-isopropylmalate synthase, partial [Defluviitaleaceae bacterium]|nr:2-isopropylmalate synthase [Defluviitaleaceae bacterium]